MKITKSQLRGIIKEEFSELTGMPDLSKVEELLEDLLIQLGKLDLSIDYLAASITGEDALSIGATQSALGRLATAPRKATNIKESTSVTKNELRNLVKQVISEQNINLSDLENELEGKTDQEIEEDIVLIAKRLVELEKKMKELSDQYQAGIENAQDIIGKQRQ